MLVSTCKVHSSANSPDGKRQLVNTIDVNVYESHEELVEALGKDTVLSLANTQNITNAKNRARAAATGKPSKDELRFEAMMRMTDDQKAKCSGNMELTRSTIDQIVAEIELEHGAARQKRVQALATVEAADAADSDDDSDDDLTE